MSVTVNGDNLWFTYHIQVDQYVTKVHAQEASQHSLQFNYDPENDNRISTDVDHMKITVSSHFLNPVKESHVRVTRKVSD